MDKRQTHTGTPVTGAPFVLPRYVIPSGIQVQQLLSLILLETRDSPPPAVFQVGAVNKALGCIGRIRVGSGVHVQGALGLWGPSRHTAVGGRISSVNRAAGLTVQSTAPIKPPHNGL